MMINIVIGIAVAIVLWGLRRAWYAQRDIFTEKVDLAIKDQQVDLQEDYLTLQRRITDTKAKQGDKWFTMKDIDELMK
jgi:hypothetical protein